MKINGKSIKGIFLYSEDVEYEKGDFVIIDSMIYVSQKTAIGINPSTSSEYFLPYLAGETATADEIISGNGGDKYISAVGLLGVLNNYYSGFNVKGEITNEITGDGDLILKDLLGNDVKLTTQHYLDPMETLIRCDEVNNGIFKVSRSVSSLKSLVATGTRAVLLRQYTYEEDGERVRVQELVDEENGHMMYRSLRGNLSGWKSMVVNSSAASLVNDIINHYKFVVDGLRLEEIELQSRFKFKSVDYSNYYFAPGNVITITTKELDTETGINSAYSATISLNSGIEKYKVGTKILTLNLDGTSLDITGGNIVDVFVRQKYKP